MTSPLRPLTVPEARVLGTLLEKARTVPDSYPLSLHLVLTGANQKTSRDPVMQLSESEVQSALDELRSLNLVLESSGGRVARYEHNLLRRLQVPEQSSVLLGLLMLRGPQTAAELRINADRWYRFADSSSVEAFLEELSARPAGALVEKLPRQVGMREARWAHLLGGPVDPGATAGLAADPGDTHTDRRLATLEAEVDHLKAQLQRLMRELGLD